MKNKVLYVVPCIDKKNSGPAVRVSNIIKSNFFKVIVFGGVNKKIASSIKVERNSLIYIESATNRIKIVDFFCLVFLKYIKCCSVHVYIRDCYTIFFPEEYIKFRKRITKLFSELTNKFYIKIADKMYFPTLDMGEVFKTFYKIDKYIDSLPPGIDQEEYDSFNFPVISKGSSLYIIHVGGLHYKYSGLDELLEFAFNLESGIKLLLVTRDESLVYQHPKFNILEDKLEIISLNREQIVNRLSKKDIIAAIHSRPINQYDSITYPIKILDYISWKLPIISLRHKPIVDLLSDNYPFFFDSIEDFSYEFYLSNLFKVEAIYNTVYSERNYKKILNRLVD